MLRWKVQASKYLAKSISCDGRDASPSRSLSDSRVRIGGISFIGDSGRSLSPENAGGDRQLCIQYSVNAQSVNEVRK